jgi:hypothetical protein
MVALPAATPLTIPVAEPIVAIEVLLLLQVPPEVALFNVVVLPVHTVAVPVMVPADGVLLTVTTAVAVAVPQPDVTE